MAVTAARGGVRRRHPFRLRKLPAFEKVLPEYGAGYFTNQILLKISRLLSHRREMR